MRVACAATEHDSLLLSVMVVLASDLAFPRRKHIFGRYRMSNVCLMPLENTYWLSGKYGYLT